MMFTLLNLIQYRMLRPSSDNKIRKEINGIQIETYYVKVSLYADDEILCIEDFKY